MPLRSLVFLLLFWFCAPYLSAQFVPDALNYQAVARNVGGLPLANQSVTVRMSVLAESPNGNLLFQEVHTALTNDFGLFTLEVGHGIPTGNAPFFNFTEVPWSSGPTFLQVEIDVPDAGGYELMGTSPLLVVPYAMHAATADSAPEADPTNELITQFSLTGSTLSITENNGTPLTVDLSPLTGGGDGDTDSENEWITDATLESNVLTLFQGSHETTVDLSPVVGSAWVWNNNTLSTSASQVAVGTNQPSSTLTVQGSMALGVQTYTSTNNAAVQSFDLDGFVSVAICDVTIGSIILNVPTANSCPGRIYKIRRFFTGATSINTISIRTLGPEPIEGAQNWDMNKPTAEYATIVSDGSRWFVLDHSWE
jgi:hypothetical protein